jgi:hypothetical protein
LAAGISATNATYQEQILLGAAAGATAATALGLTDEAAIWQTHVTDTLAAIDSPQPWMLALAAACAEDASTASAE